MMKPWWQTGIVYQIYPRSFQDTNGDGIGDLPGIMQRLDYLQWLGIDAIWISPIYPSPMKDFGYDIANYVDIHPIFGTLADMDELIMAAHQRHMKVLLDFVPNHTSDQHPWFLESRASRDKPKRDWYIWRDPAPDGGPPNNWLSRFDGESGWAWDQNTEQYYLHSFLAEQPDLNWRNPEVQQAMFQVMRFWLDRGIDGFRIDVVYRVMKDSQLRDNPPNPDWHQGQDPGHRLIEKYNKNTPDSHLFNRWLRSVVDEYEDRVLIGEINLPLTELVTYYGRQDEIHLPQNINLHETRWEAGAIRQLADKYEQLLPEDAWPNWVLGNHDQHRLFTRVGKAQGHIALMLLLTLRGTPIIYYGDEIGMCDGDIPADKVQDPWEKQSPGLGLGRDPERTPMQWDSGANAGFTDEQTEPWLPLAADYQHINVEREKNQADSILVFVKELIALRRDEPALHLGTYQSYDAPDGLFVFSRQHEADRFLILLNFSSEAIHWTPPEGKQKGRVRLNTYLDQSAQKAISADIVIRANEGILVQLSV